MTRARPALACAVALVSLGVPLQAQVSASLDLASGSASYDGMNATSILAIAPNLRLQTGSWSFGATGNYTSFESGGWSGQGSIAASWFTPVVGPLVGELSARGDHSGRGYGGGAGQALAFARVHLFGDGRGIWVGNARGQAWSVSDRDRVMRWDGGIWARFDESRWSLNVAQGTSFDTMLLVVPSTIGRDTFAQRVKTDFSEATMSLDWVKGPVELYGSFSRRLVGRVNNATSWQAAATFWITPYLGVIGGGGRLSRDPWQAHPGGRYFTLSLRVGLQPAVRARLRSRPSPPPAGVTTFDLMEVAEGRWVLRVRAPLAQLVEVTGDFTDWQPLRLEPLGDGNWTALLPLTPGTYRMNLRVDGGSWSVPPGVGTTEDEFSGRVGLIVVARN